MPVPISVTGFKNLAGDQNVHAEIAETASAGDWFSKCAVGVTWKRRRRQQRRIWMSTTKSDDDDGNARRKRATLGHRGERFRLFLPRHRWRADSRLRTSHQRDEFAPETWVVLFTLGANGAGKTTLLKIMGGKHMVPREKVLILGREAFYDTSLTSSGDLSYIGGNWQRDVAFAGYNIPLAGDFPASKMLDGIKGVDPARKKRIIDALDVDVEWRMHQVSDGQRRRVQLAWGLMHEFKVLLLDEITVDLDVLGRAELMKFLRQECEERQCTILYATHIFDGLEKFASHVAFVAGGKLQFCKEMESIPSLKSRKPGALLKEVEIWLREDARLRPRKKKTVRKSLEQARNNGWGEGRLGSTLAKGEELRNGISQIKNASNTLS